MTMLNKIKPNVWSKDNIKKESLKMYVVDIFSILVSQGWDFVYKSVYVHSDFINNENKILAGVIMVS